MKCCYVALLECDSRILKSENNKNKLVTSAGEGILGRAVRCCAVLCWHRMGFLYVTAHEELGCVANFTRLVARDARVVPGVLGPHVRQDKVG